MDKIQVVPTLEKNKNKKVPVEIDYDKLAEAIVKANLKTEKIKTETEKNRIKNKKLSKGTIALMVIFAIFSTLFILGAILNFTRKDGTDMGIKCILWAGTYIVIFFTTWLIGKNNEINFVINIISLVIALTALVIAI